MPAAERIKDLSLDADAPCRAHQSKKPLTISSGRGRIAEKGHLTPVSGKTQGGKYAAGGRPDIGPA